MSAGQTGVHGFAIVVVNGIVAVRSARPTAEVQADTARRLAICLLEAAQDAERPEPPEWP